MKYRVGSCLLLMVFSVGFQSVFCNSSVAAAPSDSSGRQSRAPSFDCTKASTKSEQLICSDKELSEADLKLSQLYKRALSSSAEKDALKKEQQMWIKNRRDLCTDAPSMLQAYQERITSLEKGVPSTSAGYTGTYESKGGMLEILQTSKETLKFNISATWRGENPDQVNVGETCGEVTISNDTAVFYDKETDCVLAMRFNKNKTLSVSQKGSCGFGMGVDASGLYKLTKGTAPQISCSK